MLLHQESVAYDQPKVTVVITALNASLYLQYAINSILEQTFHELEVIFVNDGSTDDTNDIIKSYSDPRIIIIDNKQNKGQSYSRNLAINIAKGRYIAIMDADDIAYPERIEEQFKYLEQHPDISFCASWADIINEKGETLGTKKTETNPDILLMKLLFECPIIHPTVMLRKEDFIRDNLLYDEKFRYAQDYELWSRALDTLKIGIIPKSLLKLRFHNTKSVSVTHREEQIRYAKIISNNNLTKATNTIIYDRYITNSLYLILIYKLVINNKNFLKGKKDTKISYFRSVIFQNTFTPYLLKKLFRRILLN